MIFIGPLTGAAHSEHLLRLQFHNTSYLKERKRKKKQRGESDRKNRRLSQTCPFKN